VVVSRLNAEGMYELIMPGGAVQVADWSDITEGLVVEARVTGSNKGGLECEVNHIRAFMPAGQISIYRVEDLTQFVGEKMNCLVTECNPNRGNLILSRRRCSSAKRPPPKNSCSPNSKWVRSAKGLSVACKISAPLSISADSTAWSNISQLSWDRIKHANEVLEIGQKIKVRVQRVDAATGKISLGFRDLADNPWDNIRTKYTERAKVRGTITRIMDFGVFVRLEAGIEGLVHISELSHKRVWRASDVVQEGQEVDVLVLTVDPEQQRISLSMKALEARATR